MKRVFSSASEVIHVWAQQTQSEGSCSNVYFENTKQLYSYGRHYPLGLFVTNKKGEQAVIINTQGYSSTTSKHISGARYATNHYKQFLLPNTEAMKAILHSDVFVKNGVVNGLSEAITRRIDGYYRTLRSDTKKRKAKTLESWKDAALSQCNAYIELLDWYGFKMSPAAKRALAKLSGLSPVEAQEAAKKAAAVEAKKRAKAEKARQAENERLLVPCVNAWLEGYDHFQDGDRTFSTGLIRNVEQVYLRIKGEDIETSKGAAFPIEHGLKALPMIEAAKGKGWHKNGHTIHLGHYQLDEILPSGDVKAGCHFVPYSEIKRIAKILKA